MAYQSVTNQLLELISAGGSMISNITFGQYRIDHRELNESDVIKRFENEKNEWYEKSKKILLNNDLILEYEEFGASLDQELHVRGISPVLNKIINLIVRKRELLIKFAKNIESKSSQTEVVPLTIDDFDNFEDIKKINFSEVDNFSADCFLEDDVENAFLEKLGEPYKELDSGAETRDLFSDRIIYKEKRLSSVFMFKGRGQTGELTIKKAGSTGNQLLKLAKNNSAECFIVQHTNKINPDVREALQDHILQNTRLSKVYICFIDGADTARFLKSVGKDLEELRKKVGS